jgi:hypothetical protein
MTACYRAVVVTPAAHRSVTDNTPTQSPLTCKLHHSATRLLGHNPYSLQGWTCYMLQALLDHNPYSLRG